MTRVPTPKDILDRIIALTKRVERLEKAPRTGSTSIDKGALLVKNGDRIIAVIGDVSQGGSNLKRPDGTPQMGFLLYRDNGQIALAMYDANPLDPAGYQQFMSIFDLTGAIVVSDDVNTGWGLATPWIPAPVWLDTDPTRWKPVTAGGFNNCFDSFLVVQQPKLHIDFYIYCDTGTSGQARVTVNDVVVGPTITGDAGYTEYDNILTMNQSDHWQEVKVTIQAGRTAGTGNVYVAPRKSYGRQT